jgi:hypothetical protein
VPVVNTFVVPLSRVPEPICVPIGTASAPAPRARPGDCSVT